MKVLIGSLLLIGILGLAAASGQPVHAASLKYVALGDSVAAGAGLPLAANASREDQLCGRSAVSYPALLAAKLKTTVTDLACSDAKTSDGIISSQSVASGNQTYTLPSQLDRAFQNGVPDLITLTVGANDIDWQYYAHKCAVATCGTSADSLAVGGLLTYYQGKLAYTLNQIKSRSGSHQPPKVLITEYYYPVSSSTCISGLTQSEATWFNYEVYNLNKATYQTIAATSKVSSWFKGTYNFATYVPVNFNGHGLCSADPWVQTLTDPAPLHPTATGASTIANALYSYGR